MISHLELVKEQDVAKMNGDAVELASLTHYLQLYPSEYAANYETIALDYINKRNVLEELLEPGYTDSLFPINIDVAFPGPKKHDFTFIDLFAGIGGFRLAAQEHKGKCVFSSEWDKFACQTYFKNFGEVPFGDIAEIDASSIPDHDILFAGFPCQPFSYSGRNEGFKDKTRGTLFFEILRIIDEKRPKMFLLENVKGLKSHDSGATLSTIIDALQALGYHTYWKILKSSDFGLPQARERWYCVGSIEQIDFFFPEPTNKNVVLRDIVEADVNSPQLRLSDFENSRIDFHFQNMTNEVVRVKHDSSKYEAHTKKGRHGVYSYLKKDGSLRFHVGDHAKTQIQEAFYCSLDSKSPTIIANRVPKLLELRRKLSIKESQRLQGFPDNYSFPVSDNQAYKQLGNSVSIPVVKLLIEKMTKHL